MCRMKVFRYARPRTECAVFFFNDTATTEIYPLSLHDALPIYRHRSCAGGQELDRTQTLRAAAGDAVRARPGVLVSLLIALDRKSTRLNSSHSQISYAVFCLKKNKHNDAITQQQPLHRSHLRAA